jgi:2-methylisocitrate lyase-like PEP mutase family enzyme
LRELHRRGDPLVLVNVWDAASARVVAAAGAPALATASWAIAAAHGYPDGEQIPREVMVHAIGEIAHAVDVPVSADLEAGYGDDPGETAALAAQAGARGCNLEDQGGPIVEAAERVAAVRAAVGRDFVINARPDVSDPADVLARGRAYVEAGADCVFAIRVRDLEAIRTLAAELPLSVFASPSGPSLAELRDAGVVRISVGPGAMGAAYAALDSLARALLDFGTLPPEMAFRPPS